MSQEATYEMRTHRGNEYLVKMDSETGKPCKTGVRTHVFDGGDIRTHAVGCRALKMEMRGTAAINRKQGNINYIMFGFTIEEAAEEHWSDMLGQDMTIEEAVSHMGKCKCVKN